jgi:hypothetical protein
VDAGHAQEAETGVDPSGRLDRGGADGHDRLVMLARMPASSAA